MLFNCHFIIENISLKTYSGFTSYEIHLRVVIIAKHVDNSRIRSENSSKHIDGCAFSSSIVAKKAEDLALKQTET